MQFVASYPKSGNTWIRLVNAAYALEGRVSAADLSRFNEHPFLTKVMKFGDGTKYYYQAVSPFPLRDISFPAEVRLRPAAMFMLEQDLAKTTTQRPLLVKSHHLKGEVNGVDLWNPAWTDRVVNPIRDPREVCCSFAAHLGNSLEKTAEIMARPKFRIGGMEDEDDTRSLYHLLGTWSQHVRGWLSTDDIPVHTVRYEDMKENPVDRFYDILDFLGAPNLTRERVETAVRKASFDRMQEAESEHGFVESTEHQDRFFRSGKKDGWKSELPLRIVRKIEKDHGDVMEELGYL